MEHHPEPARPQDSLWLIEVQREGGEAHRVEGRCLTQRYEGVCPLLPFQPFTLHRQGLRQRSEPFLLTLLEYLQLCKGQALEELLVCLDLPSEIVTDGHRQERGTPPGARPSNQYPVQVRATLPQFVG